MRTSVLATLALILLAVPALRADTLTVTNAANNGPGSLRQTLADAADGDTIDFDPAVFNGEPGAVITLASRLIVEQDVTIDASNLAAGVTLSGGGATGILLLALGAATPRPVSSAPRPSPPPWGILGMMGRKDLQNLRWRTFRSHHPPPVSLNCFW